MEFELTDDQKGFLKWFHNHSRDRVLKLTGFAGSGKTTVLNYLGWNGTVYFCALSNQAKNILKGKVASKRVFTTSSLLGHRPVAENGKMVFKKVPGVRDKISCDDEPLLVVDESSMIEPRMLQELIATRAGKILFVGDPAQIPPVGYLKSPIYSPEYDHIPTYHLTEIVRQAKNSPIIALSQTILAHQDEFDIPGIKEINLTKQGVSAFYQMGGYRVAVCPTHAVKTFCNQMARRVNNGGVDPLQPYVNGEQFFLESPIQDGPVNGDIVKITSEPINVVFEGFNLISFDVNDKHSIMTPYDIDEEKKIKSRFRDLEYMYSKALTNSMKADINEEVERLATKIIFGSHGYALTIHKSQGSTIPHVLLCLQGLEYFKETMYNMLYTGVTRASKTLTLGYPI